VEEKEKLRKEILAERRRLSEETVTEKSRKIKENLFRLPEFGKAKTVMFYVAKGKEVRTEEMIKESIKMGKIVAVPISKVEERNLIPSLLLDYGELVPGTYGILEPREEGRQPVLPEKLELIIVPGVAFDRQGNRLGFGRGFYDNFLGKVPAHVPCLSLELQIVEELPFEGRDVPVDGVVTEEKVYLRDKVRRDKAQRHKGTK